MHGVFAEDVAEGRADAHREASDELDELVRERA
jgi:hypothetical protein